MKPERNGSCPCGSGKKYKKCCIPKYDQTIAIPTPPKEIWGPPYAADQKMDFHNWMPQMWDLKDLKPMSDKEILDKLAELGIPMTKKQFLQDIEGQYDIEPMVELWESRYPTQFHKIKGRDGDFPIFAIWELWKRWKPDQYGIHMLDDLIEEIVKSDNRNGVFSEYLRFWKLTKEHILLPLQIRSLEDLNNRFSWYYDMEALFFDLEIEFVDTFLRDKVHRKKRFVELIFLYEDLLQILPDSYLSTIQQMRCSLAQYYYYSGDIAQGEQLFQQLIHDYPHWAGGYGSWGDMYSESLFLPDIYNEEKAMEIYQIGLHQCEDKEELEERVEDMKV